MKLGSLAIHRVPSEDVSDWVCRLVLLCPSSILTHICLVDMSILINWTSPFPILELSGVLFHFYSILKLFLLANSEDPDQTPRSAAADPGLHCLPMFRKLDARLKWVNQTGRSGQNTS